VGVQKELSLIIIITGCARHPLYHGSSHLISASSHLVSQPSCFPATLFRVQNTTHRSAPAMHPKHHSPTLPPPSPMPTSWQCLCRSQPRSTPRAEHVISLNLSQLPHYGLHVPGIRYSPPRECSTMRPVFSSSSVGSLE
jgi:hypothetical protein